MGLSIRIVALAMFGLVLSAFQNCAPANFSGGDVSVQAKRCEEVLRETTVPVKLLFAVDISGSNAGVQGSDPNRAVRSGSIQAFFNDFRAKTNFSWGFITYAGVSATPLIKNGSLPIFSPSASDMQNAIIAFNQTTDAGNTPYIAALNMASQAIAQDSGEANTKYIVVFLSDGLPNPEVSDSELANRVRSILNTKAPGLVTFNAVYYGAADPIASGRLRSMTVVGNGRFLDTNSNPAGRSFAISDVIQVPGIVCR